MGKCSVCMESTRHTVTAVHSLLGPGWGRRKDRRTGKAVVAAKAAALLLNAQPVPGCAPGPLHCSDWTGHRLPHCLTLCRSWRSPDQRAFHKRSRRVQGAGCRLQG